MSAIGRQEWLDRPSYRLEHVLSFAYNALGAPPEVKISDAEFEELGDKMAARMEQLRGSTLHKLRTKGRAALVRAL